MNIRSSIILGGFAVALFSCGRIEQAEEPSFEQPQEESESYLPGVMTVEFSEELTAQIEAGLLSGNLIATKSAALNSAFEEIGVTSLERVFPDAGEWEERHRKAGLHRWYRVHYDENALPRTKAPVSLESIEGVLNAAPCPRIKTDAYFNDPYASRQWHYSNPGGTNKSGKYAWGADIDVEPVWANFTAGSSNVIVEVVDYGVEMTHPDIGPVTIPAGPEGSMSFCYGFEGKAPSSGNHGCHCAGTIAAINNNGIGVCGIAGGNDGTGGVRILSCEIFRSENEGRLNGNGENAIVWGADHGAVISSNSWGSDFEREVDARAAKEKDYASTKAAVEYFNTYAGTDKNGDQTGPMKGGVVFFSAGNDNWRAGWPAKLECVVAVGASTALNTKTSYSNYGDWVDICAPGGDGDISIMSCLTGGSYGGMNGTSMACPHVAGVAALIVSYFGGPGFTREMLLDRLLGGASSEKMAPSQNIGPLVDAYASFCMNSTIAPDPVSDLALSSSTNNVVFTWSVSPDADDKQAGKFLLVLSDKASDMDGLSPSALPEGVRSWTLQTGTKQVGDQLSWEFKGLKFDTDYYCTVFARDMTGNFSTACPVKTIRTCVNNPPVFDDVCESHLSVKAHDILRFTITAHDPDGHNLSLSIEPGSKAATVKESKGGKIILEISGRNDNPGTYICKVIATDEYGCASEFQFSYTLLENNLPVLLKSIDDIQFKSRGETAVFDLKEYFNDPDGERLVYKVSTSSEGIVETSLTGSTLSVKARDYGSTTVKVRAVDTCGGAVEFSFRVLLRDGSNAVDIYPNPVTAGILNIRPTREAASRISITSKTGAIAFSTETVAGPFSPVVVDMKSMAAGIYYVTFKSEWHESTYTVVKL